MDAASAVEPRCNVPVVFLTTNPLQNSVQELLFTCSVWLGQLRPGIQCLFQIDFSAWNLTARCSVQFVSGYLIAVLLIWVWPKHLLEKKCFSGKNHDIGIKCKEMNHLNATSVTTFSVCGWHGGLPLRYVLLLGKAVSRALLLPELLKGTLTTRKQPGKSRVWCMLVSSL